VPAAEGASFRRLSTALTAAKELCGPDGRGHRRKPLGPLLPGATAATAPVCPLLPAGRPDSVRICEHAYQRTACDLTRRVTPGGAGRKQGVARRVKVLDIRKGHRPPTCAGRVESDLEAIEVVPDVVRLVGMR
jgi:hypothetical protein